MKICFFSPVLKSPTHIGFIGVKKMGKKSHTWAPLSQNIKILQKKFFDWAILGEVQFFHVVLGLRGIKIVFNQGQTIFFSTSYMTPLNLL